MELNLFDSRSRVEFDIETCCDKKFGGNKPFISGGQGRVYRGKINGKDTLLKVMPDFTLGAAQTFRRLKGMRGSFMRLKDTLKLADNDPAFDRVTYRGLPIGQGTARPDEFQYPQAKTLYIFAFHFIDGPLLEKYLKDEEPLSERRKKVAKQIIDIMIFLRQGGIVHNDLYPDNFIVDRQGKVFIMDLEGAGIRDNTRRNWEWKPTVGGKPQIWPVAPEVESGTPTFQSDIWIGAYLLFWTLTGFKPLDFMSRIDKKAMDDLYDSVNHKRPCWPPILQKELRFVNSAFPPEKMKEFMDYYFQGTHFGATLFATYVPGYKKPHTRPSFRFFKYNLNNILGR